jgi:hypothetical protein
MTDQGQSRATIDKERRIGSALSIGMRIVANKFGGKGFNYFHFDANAGSGWNERINVPGSPRVFWTLADEYLQALPPFGFFAEKNLHRAADLLAAVPSAYAHNSYVFARDNEQALEVFAEFIRKKDRPRFAVGSIIVDPDGWFYRNAKGEGAPIIGLQRFAAEFPRIDIILNLNGRTYRLQKPHGHAVQSPEQIFQSLRKSYWLIGYANYGGCDFLLAVGRNTPTGDHKSIGMYTIDSPQGRHIINLIEGKRQGGLFDADAV